MEAGLVIQLCIRKFTGYDLRRKAMGKVVGLKREEELEIPYEALREGVINALCHRRYDDYREGLQLGIYDDRVEICNPGRFPTGVTPENIKTLHSSKPRNLHIAQVMYKAAYLEGWGTGIKRMIDVCKAHNLPEPFYQIWADGTIVLTFQRPKTAKNGEEFGEEFGYVRTNCST